MGPTRPARIAMTVITTSSSMRVKPLVRRNTQHLLHRRDSGLHFHPPVLTQGDHSRRSSQIAQRGERRQVSDGVFNVVSYREELKEPGAAAVTGIAAFTTSFAAIEDDLA